MTSGAPQAPIASLLREWGEGRSSADEVLLARVQEELRRLARSQVRGDRQELALRPIALVRDAWSRLVGDEPVELRSRARFFGIAARVMRQILIDYARTGPRRLASLQIELGDPAPGGEEPVADVLAVHEALERLTVFDERRARVLELRCFAGLDRDEIAEVLGIAERVVQRDLVVARAWLRRELAQEPRPRSSGA